MHRSRGRRAILALTGAALLIALVAAGCGRRAQPADADAAGAPAATPAAVVQPSAVPVASPSATPVAATERPTSAPSVAPDATPVPTPDLTGIESLLTEIGHNLDADASAGTSEGSPR